MSSAEAAGHHLADPPAIDHGVLAALLAEIGDDDGALLQDLVESYLGEASGQVAKLSAAAGAADGPTVASIAHSLRSASALLGATSLAALLGRAEAAARAGSDLSGVAEPVQAEFARVSDALTIVRTAGLTGAAASTTPEELGYS